MRVKYTITPSINSMRNRKVLFRCASLGEIQWWAHGGDPEENPLPPCWRWEFCLEAKLEVCRENRLRGLCCRTPEEFGRIEGVVAKERT